MNRRGSQGRMTWFTNHLTLKELVCYSFNVKRFISHHVLCIFPGKNSTFLTFKNYLAVIFIAATKSIFDEIFLPQWASCTIFARLVLYRVLNLFFVNELLLPAVFLRGLMGERVTLWK